MFPIMLAVAAAVTLYQTPGTPDSEAARAGSVVVQFSEYQTSYLTTSVERVTVDHNAIDSTIEALQMADGQGLDAIVLWIGVIEDRNARVLLTGTHVNDLADLGADEPLVSSEWRTRLIHALSESGLRLIAEVHSRAKPFGDSDLSNRNVASDSDGALVLIAPTQSRESDPTKWTGYRRLQGGWRSLSVPQMQTLLYLRSERSAIEDGKTRRDRHREPEVR